MKPLKPYEKESLLKTFFIFFTLLELLLVLLFWQMYRNAKQELHKALLQQMQLCSYTIECKKFTLDFVPKSGIKTNTLYSKNQTVYAYFPVPESQKYSLLITYPAPYYKKDLQSIVRDLLIKFSGATFVLFLLSLFFTYYTLRPLRKALRLNDEFVKDILHDYNTPVTAMKLSIEMLKRTNENNPHILRISQAIDTLTSLQENFKSFLKCSPGTMQTVDIGQIAHQRVEALRTLYPSHRFQTELSTKLKKHTHPQLLGRIIDNLLSNAAKYGGKSVTISVFIKDQTLIIEDDGRGIKNTKAVLQRYGVENTRGNGLGLHIVQKLCDELGIIFHLESTYGKGTKAILDFRFVEGGRQ